VHRKPHTDYGEAALASEIEQAAVPVERLLLLPDAAVIHRARLASFLGPLRVAQRLPSRVSTFCGDGCFTARRC